MTVYNGAAWLDASIQSVIEQTFKEFEFVIVDDGSTDETVAILAEWRLRDARIRVISQENRGHTNALNVAVRQAVGEYLAQQDVDDISEPERFAVSADYLDREGEVAVVAGGGLVIDAKGTPVGRLPIVNGRRRMRGLLLRENVLYHGSTLARRSIVHQVGAFREAFRYSQDYDLWLRIAERHELENLPDTLFRWRISPEGIYSRHRAAQIEYAALARAFAWERRRYGEDSYGAFATGDLDVVKFASGYRLAGHLFAALAEYHIRSLGDIGRGRRYLLAAMRRGHFDPRVLVLLAVDVVWRRWRIHAPGSKGGEGKDR